MKPIYAPIRIILADDHELFRDGFRSFIKKHDRFQLIAEASNGEQLVSLTQQHLPDVVITDIQMPVMNGIAATRIITTKFPQVGVIALSMFIDDALIMEMLAAGAKGYIIKNAHKADILEAITTVAKHQSYYCNETSTKLSQLIANSSFDPKTPVVPVIFSKKEIEVITLICKEYFNKDISIALNMSVRTVEGYRERILQKTNARNTAGIVIYAVKNHIYKF